MIPRAWIVAFATTILVGVPAGLATPITQGTWLLDQSNTFADGVTYGTVAITADAGAGTVQFQVTAMDVQPTYGALNKFGIQKFGFNYENVTSSPATWTVSLPANWSQSNPGGQISAFGEFEISEVTSGANTRQNPLVFTLTLPNPAEAIASNFAVLSSSSAGQGNQFFAAHVAGFANGGGSHYIGGSGSPIIPEPTTVLLLAAGLMACIVRRR